MYETEHDTLAEKRTINGIEKTTFEHIDDCPCIAYQGRAMYFLLKSDIVDDKDAALALTDCVTVLSKDLIN